MRCRYCNQRLNFFKSLSGSSFCSHEHQKLYEKAQANTAFERLLEFVEKEDKPAAGPAKPAAPTAEPPAVAVPHEAEAVPRQIEPAIPAAKPVQAESPVAKAQEQEPPVAAFLFGPIAAPAQSTLPQANFEIQAPDIAPPVPALPAWSAAILADEPDQAASASAEAGPVDLSSPPPLASWSAFSLVGIDTPQASSQVETVGPVRPRAATLEIPSAQNPQSAPPAASFLISQAVSVADNRDMAQLARLIPLQPEARSPNFAEQPALTGKNVAALAQANRMELSAFSSMAASSPSAPPAVLLARLQYLLPSLQDELKGSARPTLRARTVADFKLDQSEKRAPVAMHPSMTRAVAARAVRQPQLNGRMASSALHKTGSVTGVSAGVQNIGGPKDYAISPSLIPPRECIVPAVRSQAAAIRARLASLAAHAKFRLRENDRSAAVGSPEVPERFALPSPRSPAVCTFPGSVGLGRGLVARIEAARVQAQDGSRDCAISPARPARQECLLPGIAASTKTRVPAAGVSSGWFQQTDSRTQSFQAGAPAERRLLVRFAPLGGRTCRPAIAFLRTARRLVFETREWKAEQEKLEHSRPSGTSPLALVVRPQMGIQRAAVQPGIAFREFASIASPAQRGPGPPDAACVSSEEAKLTISLPGSANSQWRCAFLISRMLAAKSLAARPTDGPDAAIFVQSPAAFRVQPASMLVLPQSHTPSVKAKRVSSVGWATVSAASPPYENPAGVASSEECSLPSLRRLSDALRIEGEDPAPRLNPSQSAMSLESGIQTSPLGVPAANALPRRRGPQLPVVKAQLGGLLIADR